MSKSEPACVVTNTAPPKFVKGQLVRVLPNDRRRCDVGKEGFVKECDTYNSGEHEYFIGCGVGFREHFNEWELEAIGRPPRRYYKRRYRQIRQPVIWEIRRYELPQKCYQCGLIGKFNEDYFIIWQSRL